MNVYLIWTRTEGYAWLVESWDEESIDANEAGWDEAVQKARTEHGPENIRIIKASIDFDKVLEAFNPPENELTIILTEP
jgi:hypothetical protein